MLNPWTIVSSEPDLFIHNVCFLLLITSTSIRQERKRNFFITNRGENTPNYSSWISDQLFASLNNPSYIRYNARQSLFHTFLLMLGGLFDNLFDCLLFEAV